MNRSQLLKNVGDRVRLRPQAMDVRGARFDDDWILRSVSDAKVELENTRTGDIAVLGLDHLYGYTSDPAGDTETMRHGFLSLHVEIIVGDGRVIVEPLPPPRAAGAGERAFRSRPLVVHDGERERLFSWRDRDPVHLISGEEPASQLLEFYIPLCDALRGETGREPEFSLPDDLRGEIVFELSPDLRAKWRLLGGNGGKPGKAILVLTTRAA